jgi:hypothetical protein
MLNTLSLSVCSTQLTESILLTNRVVALSAREISQFHPLSSRPAQALVLWSDLFQKESTSSPQFAIQGSTIASSTTATASRPQVPEAPSRPPVNDQVYESIFDAAMTRAQTHQSAESATATALSVWAPQPPFQPNQMALAQRGLITASSRSSSGSSTKYQGDQYSNSWLAQLPEGELPDAENCSLFVTNVPTTATPRALFDLINVGPVFALHMMDPDDTHPFQAAKLVFMNPESAQRMMDSPNIWMRRRCLGFRYNRYGCRRSTRNYSRVLIVEGPEGMMKLDSWNKYFVHYSKFVMDRVLKVECATPGNKAYEFRFSRIDGQAETCFMAIKAEPYFAGLITVQYGADPCDRWYDH